MQLEKLSATLAVFTLHSAHFRLCTTHSTLHTEYCTLHDYTTHCTLDKEHYSLLPTALVLASPGPVAWPE